MADSKTPVIEIKTIDAVRNVKDLKDNISALKAKIDNVNTSTDEYADLTKQLSQNQAALRNVMNGTNSTFDDSIRAAQGLDSSYNSLVQQLKEATQEWRTIPKYLSDADKEQGVLNLAWKDAANKVNDLRTELKAMDSDTGSYVRNVGNYKSALEGFSGAMGQMKQIGGDMVNGLSAAANTMALMGISSDGLTDSMKNLRIVVAAIQGAKGFAGMISQLRSYFKAGKEAVATTKAQTVALEGEAAAQTAANTATSAGAVAMGVLQKAIIATGIGALVVGLGMLVAHFEDVVKWIGKVGEKLGIVSKQAKVWENANEKLTDKFSEQNRQLELQQRIYAAQGKSKKQLLLQQKTQIELQIKETEATIKTIEARIKEMEADSAWVRFWKGENAQIRKAKEEVEALTASLKEMNESKESITIDIQVEDIEAGNKAASDAAKEAEKAVELAQNVLNSGIESATKLINEQKTELQKLEAEHKTNVNVINSAITATEKLTGITDEQRQILKNGLVAEGTRYTKALQAYYKSEYEKKAGEQLERIGKETEAIWRYDTEKTRTEQEIFKLREDNNLELAKEYDLLKKQVAMLKRDIEPEIFNQYLDLANSGLTGMREIDPMTEEDIRKQFGEPTAEAILAYLQKENEFRLVGEKMQRQVIEGFEDGINKAVESGDFVGAELLWNSLHTTVWDLYGGEDAKLEVAGLAAKYLQSVADGIQKAKLEAKLPEGGLISAIFDGPGYNRVLERQRYELEEQIEHLKQKWADGCADIEILTAQVTALNMQMWDNYFHNIYKHFDTYGRAISNVMGSVADAWEAALQAQVKNGKKSEEEAKKSFNAVKALQIGVAVINTAASVTSALADPTVPSYFVKAANAVAALAAGTAQVIKITQTEFSANANMNSPSMNEAPAMVDRTPQLQYTYGLNAADYAEAAAQNPVRAFVVDKDISDGLNEYNRRRENTTF